MVFRLIAGLLLGFLINYAYGQNPRWLELYQSAKAHAANGQHDAALTALEQTASAGFRGLGQLRGATEFEALRDNPRFAKVLAAVRKNLFPCEEGKSYGDFDFWIGTWDVYDGNDKKAGTNRITLVENGCALEEIWTGVSGITGRSLNFYDPNKDRWRQYWVSATGAIIDIAGNLVGGSMVLVGQIYYTSTGLTADFRGTWTPLEDGRVRQFFEQYDPDAETWNSWFEGFYVRQR